LSNKFVLFDHAIFDCYCYSGCEDKLRCTRSNDKLVVISSVVVMKDFNRATGGRCRVFCVVQEVSLMGVKVLERKAAQHITLIIKTTLNCMFHRNNV
jgi:hypothetical protein